MPVVWIAVDGNNKRQMEEMSKISMVWGTNVRTKAFDRQDS